MNIKSNNNPPCYTSKFEDLIGADCNDVTYMEKTDYIYHTLEKTTDFGDVDIFDLSLKSRKIKDGNDEHKVSN